MPSDLGENMEWVHDAGCRGKDPDLFFPVGNTGPAAEQLATAKGVCFACDVSDLCLEWAMQNSQDFGVWGGMAEDERRALRRQRRREARILAAS